MFASGVGTLAAGLLLRLAQFPQNAKPESIDPALVRNLGYVSIAAALSFGAATLYFFSRYTLDREAHRKIIEQLVRA